MKLLVCGVALLSGAALAVQVGFNNELRARMGHPMLAALASFAVGTAAILIYLAAMRPPMPYASAVAGGPSWMWMGGIVGAVYVASAAAFASRLGAAPWLALVVTGQILTSLALDHYGLIGFAIKPITTQRLAGAILLLAGVALVVRS